MPDKTPVLRLLTDKDTVFGSGNGDTVFGVGDVVQVKVFLRRIDYDEDDGSAVRVSTNELQCFKTGRSLRS